MNRRSLVASILALCGAALMTEQDSGLAGEWYEGFDQSTEERLRSGQ